MMAATLPPVWSVPELRDHIYKYAYGTETIMLTSFASAANQALHVRDESLYPIDLLYPSQARYWAQSKRRFLGLTQVCRLLRNEFLPLDQASTGYIIYVGDLRRFLDTFVLANRSKMAEVVGHVTIRTAVPLPLDYLPKPPVDILPLMKLCHRAAANKWNFYAKFGDRDAVFVPISGLNSLLNDWNDTAWPGFVERYVSRLEVILSAGPFKRVKLWVRRKYFEDEKARGSDFGDILGQFEAPLNDAEDEIRRAARGRWEESLGFDLRGLKRMMVIVQED